MIKNPILAAAVVTALMAKASTEGAAGTGAAPTPPKADEKADDKKVTNGASAKTAATAPKPAPKADPKEEPKADPATAAAKAAVAAQLKADEAVAEAKRLSQLAAAEAAKSNGMVLVHSQREFALFTGGKRKDDGTYVEGQRVVVPRGTSAQTADVAEHPYAKDHGVEVIGVPTTKKK